MMILQAVYVSFYSTLSKEILQERSIYQKNKAKKLMKNKYGKQWFNLPLELIIYSQIISFIEI